MAKKSTLILIILAVIFTITYLWLATPVNTGLNLDNRFDWPDETANYFWTKNYVQTGELAVYEPLNLTAKNQIHPRSFNVRNDGSLVPGSFLGLILFYGFLAKIFSIKTVIYFTPILAIFGILAFYGIIKRIFNEKIALLSAIIMFFYPVWWYYSVTSMLPNVAFVSLLLLGIYFLIKKEKLRLVEILISGVFTGLAISIRPSEIVWVGIIFSALFIYLRSRIKAISFVVLFLAIVSLLILPSFYYQQISYGNFLTSGYNQLNQEPTVSCQLCTTVTSSILPFGFHPRLASYNFWLHYLSRQWLFSLLAILGFIAYLNSSLKKDSKIFGYVLMCVAVFGHLIIYYGSWQFSDLLTVHLNTLGLSYVRYWIPLYLLILPFIAIALVFLTNFLKGFWRVAILALMFGALFIQSANLVLYSKPDSIIPVRNRIADYKQNAVKVIGLTEDNSVIITVRKDKLFFPERKVIHSFQDLSSNYELMDIISDLIKQAPVYYYALEPESELELENGLKLELMENIGDEILYKVY